MQAAVDMMRKVLNGVQMDGVVVIGEGEKDEVRRGCVGCVLAGLGVMPEICASALFMSPAHLPCTCTVLLRYMWHALQAYTRKQGAPKVLRKMSSQSKHMLWGTEQRRVVNALQILKDMYLICKFWESNPPNLTGTDTGHV